LRLDVDGSIELTDRIYVSVDELAEEDKTDRFSVVPEREGLSAAMN
jgi:hypothetical protein